MVTHPSRTDFSLVLIIICCSVMLSGASLPSPTPKPSGAEILKKAQQHTPRTAKFTLKFFSAPDYSNHVGEVKVQGEGSFATVSTSAGVYQKYHYSHTSSTSIFTRK